MLLLLFLVSTGNQRVLIMGHLLLPTVSPLLQAIKEIEKKMFDKPVFLAPFAFHGDVDFL
jgi:hypothetical protein